jgi:hypothetical protein
MKFNLKDNTMTLSQDHRGLTISLVYKVDDNNMRINEETIITVSDSVITYSKIFNDNEKVYSEFDKLTTINTESKLIRYLINNDYKH